MPYAKTYYTDFSSLLEPSMLEKKLPLVPPERQVRIETAKRPETKASLLAAGAAFEYSDEAGIQYFCVRGGSRKSR